MRFIRGSGSDRMNMIRTVEIGPYYPHLIRTDFSGARPMFECLSVLKDLRTLTIWAWIEPFEEVHKNLEQLGIHTLLGHLDVKFEQTDPEAVFGSRSPYLPPTERLLRFAPKYPVSEVLHTWTCASGETIWKRGNIQRKVFWKWDTESRDYVPGPDYALFWVSKRHRQQPHDRWRRQPAILPQ